MGTLREDQYRVMIISRSLLIRRLNVLKLHTKSKHTFFMFHKLVFESRAVYMIMWKCVEEPDRPQMTIWRIRIACWMPKAAHTHTQNM